MLGNSQERRQFSYTTAKSLKIEKDKPLRERIRVSSYSSQEIKFSKKKMIFYIVLLLLSLGIIIYFGITPVSEENSIKIEDTQIEKVNGQ